MATIPRMFRARSGARPAVLLAGTLVAVWLLFAGLAAPAHAQVETVLTKIGGGTVTVGLQPREGEDYWGGVLKSRGQGQGGVEENAEAGAFDNATGNEVVHSANSYVIYWDPQDYYHGDWQGLIDGFMANQGAAGGQLDSSAAVDAQYTDKSDQPAATHSSFRGAYTDTHPYPETANCTDPHPLKFGIPVLETGTTPLCLTAAQVQTELERFIKQRGEEHFPLPKGMGTIFNLLTPPGVTVCLNQGASEAAPHCSDFKGKPIAISRYEEAVNRYPEELVTYEKELKSYAKAKEAYEKEFTKYEKELTKYQAEKEVYEKNKAKDEAKSEPDVEAEPTKPTAPVAPEPPVKPVVPTKPAGWASYKTSFCSYHAAVGIGSAALLYSVIPWTAGGDGDGHLAGTDQTGGYACQDGGFAPGSNEPEEKEREKPETAKERAEWAAKTAPEKEAAEEIEEHALAKPHDQEPDGGHGADGSNDQGLADLIINQIAVEQQDTITDPLLNAWQDSARREVTDECRNFFVPTTGGSPAAAAGTLAGSLTNEEYERTFYYLNIGFNLAGVPRLHPGKEFPGLPFPGVECPNGVTLQPKFTAPNTVKGSEVVGFDGMESIITLNSAVGFSPTGVAQPNYATYTWNFGDETPQVSGYAPGAPACELPWLSSCAASVFHSYQYNGTYNVTLTVKDVGGNVASVTAPVTVVEGENRPVPPPPPPPPSGGGSGGSSGSSGSSTSSAGGGTTSGPGAAPVGKPSVAPVATAAVASTSLKSVLAKGLSVRYSVNEQVTGHFEVLLAASVAKKIGLKGPLATGLPKGTAPEIVIAKAILVTTQGGHNSVKILFGKKTAKLLHKLHKVSLMVRLIVRNGLSSSATSTTTVNSLVTLTH